MAEEKSTPRRESSQDAQIADAIPMKKASPTTWIAAGVGVLVMGGLAAFTLGGGDGPKAAAEQPKRSAGSDEPHLTAKEAQEHLLKTQKALEAAEQAEAARKAQQASEAAPEEASEPPAAVAKAPSQKASGSSAPAKKASPEQAKKKIDSLDSLGSDITSALK